jgi:hypothetical protein
MIYHLYNYEKRKTTAGNLVTDSETNMNINVFVVVCRISLNSHIIHEPEDQKFTSCLFRQQTSVLNVDLVPIDTL